MKIRVCYTKLKTYFLGGFNLGMSLCLIVIRSVVLKEIRPRPDLLSFLCSLHIENARRNRAGELS